jgi:sugar phosphate isomerase/epimerase
MSNHAANPIDLARCAVHTRTTKPWSLAECCRAYAAAGIGGISIWRDAYETIGVGEARRIVSDSGLRVPAIVRGGFFVAPSDDARRASLDDNRRIIDEAHALDAEMIVLVVGAHPEVPLATARDQVTTAIAELAPQAERAGVKLAIEPLHPMYAADKSCICTLREARKVCEAVGSPAVGVAADVYHIWWDADLEAELDAIGRQGRLFGFHVCDWRVETRHMLTDRGLMGDGVIDIRRIRAKVEAAGFTGFTEVEVFSDDYWSRDQNEYLALIVDRLRTHT